VLQQIGMLPIIIQHMHPESIMHDIQSQQHWIIEAILASPLMQVTVTPISIVSQVVVAIIILQLQHGMPFIIMTKLHMLPIII